MSNKTLWMTLIDCSGSMKQKFSVSPESYGPSEIVPQSIKLEAAKEILIREIRGFASNAIEVGVIAFSHEAKLVYQGTSTDVHEFEPKIRQLRASGGTDVAAALSLALDIQRRSTYQHLRFSVISDGDFWFEDTKLVAQECRRQGIDIDIILIDPTPEGERIARAIFEGRVRTTTSLGGLDTAVRDDRIKTEQESEIKPASARQAAGTFAAPADTIQPASQVLLSMLLIYFSIFLLISVIYTSFIIPYSFKLFPYISPISVDSPVTPEVPVTPSKVPVTPSEVPVTPLEVPITSHPTNTPTETPQTSPVRINALYINSEVQDDGTTKHEVQLSLTDLEGDIDLGYGALELIAPASMKLNESKIIRLVINPDSAIGSLERVTVEPLSSDEPVSENNPDKTLRLDDRIKIYPVMVAQLEGVNFNISSSSPKQQAVTSLSSVVWTWTIMPKSKGQQSLILTVFIPVLIDEVRGEVSTHPLKDIPIEISIPDEDTFWSTFKFNTIITILFIALILTFTFAAIYYYVKHRKDSTYKPRTEPGFITGYNLDNISKLLVEGITEEQLRDKLKSDIPAFRAICEKLTPHANKNEIAEILVSYAEQEKLLYSLLNWAKILSHTERYEHHKQYYYINIKRYIEQAIKDGITELDLSKQGVTSLPPKIGLLTNLTQLDLSNNQLSTLQPEIGQLTNLTMLSLQNNQLSALLPEIGQLTNLTKLNLSNNQLSTLPKECEQWSNLKELDLRDNPLPLPPDILARTTEPFTIIKYLRESEKTLSMIDQALKDRAIKLALSQKGLIKLPAEIGSLKNLTTLDLSNNQLRTLPPEIAQLTNLTILDLSNNQFSTLPTEIKQLSNLETLDLRGNLLPLPPEILASTNEPSTIIEYYRRVSEPIEQAGKNGVTELDLSWREITKLPPEIGYLKNLTTLHLPYNQLSTLPPEIGTLKNLTTLSLEGNQLSTLPPEIGALKNLTSLFLEANQLSTLSPEIGQLTNLTTLRLEWNELSSLPAEIGQLTNLTILFLFSNQLSTLPPQIGQLTNLKQLDLRDNPLPIPPEILSRTKEPATILDYYFRGRKFPLNEAKLLLVGQGSVGKTSLVKRLVEGEFDEHEPITEGINIKLWGVTIGDEQIKLNIWDFGGQEIMHATHQFFLTKRTLYLLVLDARQGEVSSRRDYWLKLIESFGADSPIIVVSNKIDQHPSALDERKLREKYPSIKAFVDTSCKTGQGIAELETQITTIIDQLEHVRDLIPVKWLNIKAKLEGIGKNYIAYNNEYVRLCQANNIRDEQEQRDLIRLRHDLGVVFNFEDDAQLRETIVINPEWVTGAVYQIINAKSLQNKGVLEIGQLDEILDVKVYPKEHYLLFIEMMRRFERCFDLEGHVGEKFLIPDLLPTKKPTIFWSLDCLEFEYHYNFLPSSVISRFMVQMHGFIFGDYCWRTGVVLVKDQNQALVKAVPLEKKISIIGLQQGKCSFLTEIRASFEQIHQTISTLEAIEYVGHEGVVIEYETLCDLHEMGVRYHRVGRRKGEKVLVNVKELLDSVRRESGEQEGTKIRQLLDALQQELHPQLFYSSALELGKRHYMVGAYSHARQALAVTHQALRALRGMESKGEAQVKLSQESAELYEMLVHSCVAEKNYVKAFEYAAIGKGRAFVNKLAEARFDFEAIGHQEGFADKLEQARQQRHKIEDSKSTPADAPRDTQSVRGEQYKLFQEETELWQEMVRQYPVLTATLSVPTLSAEQARALASELEATLVEYYRHSEGSEESGWCAFVVTPDAIRYVPLPLLEGELLSQLLSWRNKLHLRCGRNTFLLSRLDKLYQAAIAPLALESEQVVIAPFERLHLLPLSAARHAKGYLADEHTLSFVPSLTALYVVNQERKRRSPPLRQGEASPPRRSSPPRPLIPSPTRPKGGKGARVLKLLSVAYPGPPASRNYLPNVLDEAKAIMERLSKVALIGFLHKDIATPKMVIQEAPAYDMIHFSCHGRFKSDKPEESGLSLAGQTKEEGYLTVQRIMSELNLKQSRLATLAACLTGEVKLQEGEEHIGLLQAMMTAGVQTVIASLWHVDDASTRALFEAFYYREADIHSAPLAMRDASQLLRQKWSHPYYWAAFQVNGLPPLPKKSKPVKWPPDLLEHIEKDNQRSIITRGVTMNDQLIEDNAEVLLETMWECRSQILPALRQHPLSDKLAQQSIEAQQLEIAKVKIAKALLMIVTDNPTLRQAFSEVGEIKLDEELDEQAKVGKIGTDKQTRGPDVEQDEQTRESRPSQKQIIPVRNKVADIGDYLDLYLRQADQPVSSLSTASNQSRLSRFVAGFLSFISLNN